MTTATILPRVIIVHPNMGCDPEFFFRNKAGEVVGAEKGLPKEGLKVTNQNSRFIIDGVQAELNPQPNGCRALLAVDIANCFKQLDKSLKESGNNLTADFSRTVLISKENLLELDKTAQVFGCTPSKSIYRKAGIKIASVDPLEYRTRAAGGHIHVGWDERLGLKRAIKEDYIRVVQLMDIICGNTSVLIDRDEGNIERRKLYGRAGEYRLPKHGLEYRTLSNFWLTSYPLMSFAFGMARLAVQLMADDKNHEQFYDAFSSAVKMKNIHNAINNNDFELAMENFERIKPLIEAVTTPEFNSQPVSGSTMKEFLYFVDKIDKNGLSYWFKDDPMKHWTTQVHYSAAGFKDFLTRTVHDDMIKPVSAPVISKAALVKAAKKTLAGIVTA